jgi:hypothetical protein
MSPRHFMKPLAVSQSIINKADFSTTSTNIIQFIALERHWLCQCCEIRVFSALAEPVAHFFNGLLEYTVYDQPSRLNGVIQTAMPDSRECLYPVPLWILHVGVLPPVFFDTATCRTRSLAPVPLKYRKAPPTMDTYNLHFYRERQKIPARGRFQASPESIGCSAPPGCYGPDEIPCRAICCRFARPDSPRSRLPRRPIAIAAKCRG